MVARLMPDSTTASPSTQVYSVPLGGVEAPSLAAVVTQWLHDDDRE